MEFEKLWMLLLVCLLLGAAGGCDEEAGDDDTSGAGDSAGDDGAGDDDDDSAGDDDDSTPSDDDDSAGGPTATLTGSVTRSVDLVEDGIGNLVIRVRLSSAGQGGGSVANLTVEEVDFTDPKVGVQYEITGIPLSDEGYTVSARLDDNANGGPPDEADIRSERVAVTLDTAGTHEMDLELTLVGPPGGQGDDDDSSGDDDDSSGDDDDSSGDDDDSAADDDDAGDDDSAGDDDDSS